MEYSEEEIERLAGEMKEFVEQLSKEMHDKKIGEILPMDIAMITSVCLTRLFLHNPITLTMKHELMNTVALVANSVLKFQEHKIGEAQALEKLWKED